VVERRFSGSIQELAKTHKWRTTYVLIKTFGWKMEDLRKLSGKEARILMLLESQQKQDVGCQSNLEKARAESKKLL